MPPHDPTPIPPSPPTVASPDGSAPPVGDAATPGPGRTGAVRLWALGAGAVAALASWLCIEATLGAFRPRGTPTQFMSSTFLIPGSQERAAAATRNAALAFGLTGATAGMALGLAGGLARRSAQAGAVAAVLGLVLGAAAGTGTALVALPVASRIQERDPGNMSAEMASSLLAHGAPWVAVAAAGGLAFGIGLGGGGRAVRGMLGGGLGAVVGAILYELIVALALPEAKIVDPIAATWGLRMLAQGLAVIPAAAGVAALVSGPSPKKPEPVADIP